LRVAKGLGAAAHDSHLQLRQPGRIRARPNDPRTSGRAEQKKGKRGKKKSLLIKTTYWSSECKGDLGAVSVTAIVSAEN